MRKYKFCKSTLERDLFYKDQITLVDKTIDQYQNLRTIFFRKQIRAFFHVHNESKILFKSADIIVAFEN